MNFQGKKMSRFTTIGLRRIKPLGKPVLAMLLSIVMLMTSFSVLGGLTVFANGEDLLCDHVHDSNCYVELEEGELGDLICSHSDCIFGEQCLFVPEVEEEKKEEIQEHEDSSENMGEQLQKLGSISGFVWVDDNWDYSYDSEENPLAGYSVYLYNSSDLVNSINEAVTQSDGSYVFNELPVGEYILGLKNETIEEQEYLLPMEYMNDNSFKLINDEIEPLMAYTETIKLVDGEVVENICAGMHIAILMAPLSLSLDTSNGYIVTMDSDGEPVEESPFTNLQDAVNACGMFSVYGSFTITATGNDEEMGSQITIIDGKQITLTSDDDGPYTIVQLTTGRHFVVNGMLTLDSIILDGNGIGTVGGGVSVGYSGTLIMDDNSTIQNCNAATGGGVVLPGGGTFVMNSGSLITNCRATGSGGGVYNSGTLKMYDGAKISNNTTLGGYSSGNGGGVYNTYVFTMEGGSISSNAAEYEVTVGNRRGSLGGGVFNYGGNFTINGGEIKGNTAGSGGGIYSVGSSGILTLYDGGIINNRAVEGAGVYIGGANSASSKFIMYGGRISNNVLGVVATNTQIYYGAGVSVESATFEMRGGEISNNSMDPASPFNTTGGSGGGVYTNGYFSMYAGEIYGNSALGVGGGGVLVNNGEEFIMDGGKIYGNTAINGGGIHLLCPSTGGAGGLKMTGGEISGNTASSNGGGIYRGNYTGTDYYKPRIEAGTIKDNTAGNMGGGIYTNRLELFFVDAGVVFSNNKASYVCNRSTSNDAIYASNIKCTTWTTPLTQGYNNYDINQSEQKLYSITYNGNGNTSGTVPVDTNGSGVTGTNLYISSSSVTVQGNTGNLVRTGYYFLGWSTDINATVPTYSWNGTTISPSTFPIYSNTTLYAVWKEYRYIVTRDSDNTKIGSYHWLSDAVTACGTDGAYTITATENDLDVTDRDNNAGKGIVPAFIGSTTSASTSATVSIPATKTITLTSRTPSVYVITQKTTGRHLSVYGNLTLENIILKGVGSLESTNASGGISGYADSNITLNSGAILQNCTQVNGGGIDCMGLVTMNEGSIIQYCRATSNGGGICVNNAGTLIMNGGTITNNKGSGIGSYGNATFRPTITINGNTSNGAIISDNTSNSGGGGITVGEYTTCTITGNTKIMGNSAWTGGGVFCFHDSDTTIEGNTVISGNTAQQEGGGITVGERSNLTITGNTRIEHNSAGVNGGGINCNGNNSTTTISDNVVISENNSTNGGGIYHNKALTITGGTIIENAAKYGGGIYSNSTLVISDTDIIENTASSLGGGIYADDNSIITINSASISYNKGTRGAGGIYNRGTVTMNNGGEISHNSILDGDQGGGGVYNLGDFTMKEGSSISYNKGIYHGGGVNNNIEEGIKIGNFIMLGGVIEGNTSSISSGTGGGIHNYGAIFTMNGGTIASNIAGAGGGIYNINTNNSPGVVNMNNGIVSNNTARYGGGICNIGSFTMKGDSKIINNGKKVTIVNEYTLENEDYFTIAGGGIWNEVDWLSTEYLFEIQSGEISGNTASTNGGGIHTSDYSTLKISSTVVFSNNSAETYTFDRNPLDDAVYNANIKSTKWTTPFIQGYNNYDINHSYNNTSDEYTVKYNANTGFGSVPIDNNSYKSGSNATVLSKGNLTKEGYNFTGWNTAANGSGTSYAVGVQIKITKDITLYAQWTKIITYTVTYEGNENTGGSVPVDSKAYVSGSTVTILDSGSLVKSGYSFSGWGTSPLGSKVYDTNNTFTIDKDITLYAQWTLNVIPVVTTYTVRYLPGTRGTFATVTYGSLVSGTATPGAPAVTGQTGYTFAGWSPARAATVTNNVDYVAQWTLTVLPTVSYTVTFVDYDGTVLKTEVVEEGSSASAPTTPTRVGYRFTSWDRTFMNIRSNITVTAQYEEVSATTTTTSFTVRFVDFDGRVLKAEEVAAGGSATAPANPAREGYNFSGWDVGFTNVQSDITVTAQYSRATTITPVEEYTREEIIEKLKEEGIPTFNLGGVEVPLAAGSMNGLVWALLNLILMVVGLILGVISIMHSVIKKRHEETDYESDSDEETRKAKVLWLVASIITAVAGIIVFFLTEKISLPMVLVDKWTIVNGIILALGLVSFIFVIKNKKDSDDVEPDNVYVID